MRVGSHWWCGTEPVLVLSASQLTDGVVKTRRKAASSAALFRVLVHFCAQAGSDWRQAVEEVTLIKINKKIW